MEKIDDYWRRLNQPQRQLARRSSVGVNKISEMLRHGFARNVAPGLNFLSDIFGNVVCPVLQSIERYYANRIIELPGHKIGDNRFKIRSLSLSFAVNAAAAKAIHYQICRLVRAVGHGTR